MVPNKAAPAAQRSIVAGARQAQRKHQRAERRAEAKHKTLQRRTRRIASATDLKTSKRPISYANPYGTPCGQANRKRPVSYNSPDRMVRRQARPSNRSVPQTQTRSMATAMHVKVKRCTEGFRSASAPPSRLPSNCGPHQKMLGTQPPPEESEGIPPTFLLAQYRPEGLCASAVIPSNNKHACAKVRCASGAQPTCPRKTYK